MDGLNAPCLRRTASGFRKRIGLLPALVTGLTVLALHAPAAAVIERTPMESVKSTIADVIRILNRHELKQPGRTAERRQEIERVVRHRVSYEEMAKRALGPAWSDLTDSERQEFVDLFVQLLRDSFAGKIDAYADEQVVYLSELREAHLAEVRMKLTGSKVDTHLDFRMADRAGEWLVYDVVIDGASIVSNYRAQFATIIRDHAYAGLVERMRQKALVGKAFERAVGP
jgi:phospholipid transport system substrate-binding protein